MTSEHDGLDEEGNLHLGDEFSRAGCMLISEVALLLEKRAAEMPEDEELNPYVIARDIMLINTRRR